MPSPDEQSAALRWITGTAQHHALPYQIVGGPAAIAHGVRALSMTSTSTCPSTTRAGPDFWMRSGRR
ncbi:hypothetical protein [Dinoroseobacter sp. S375]|uniref:hypothetical protein n=1 Tax=Dinoroseobacter sp. S375 TaxID=3415136 RepID=UPI003C7E8795